MEICFRYLDNDEQSPEGRTLKAMHHFQEEGVVGYDRVLVF